MASELPFNISPYPWIALSALCMGASWSALTRFCSRARELERCRNRKWILFLLGLSLALVFFLGALFIPGPEKIRDIRIPIYYLVITAFFFLVFRFKKSLGILAIFLLLALFFTFKLFLQSLQAYTGETEIGRLRVLSARDRRMSLEILPAKGEPAFVQMTGSYFAPVVRVVIFEDYLVLLGAKTWYRFEGLSSFDVERTSSRSSSAAGSIPRQQDTDFYFPQPSGIPERLWVLFERYERFIPGVRSVQVEMDLKRARELAVYSIRIQNDGGVQILEAF